jgi:hypothetical protein
MSASRPSKDEPGWETSYDEFCQLLDLPSRAVVAPLLKDWFGYEVSGGNGRPEIRSASGERVKLADVHQQIQDDAERRYDFYQRKMSCFHWDPFAERCYREYLAAQASRG